ncbi:MAG TPA: hypothetical protein VIG64_15405, partial [Actinomycetota bacterium]
MGVIKHRVAVWFVVMLFAIASAVVAFQMTSNNGSGPRIMDGQLLADPNPDKGKDCPYPPPGSYGKVAKGREQHCNSPAPPP